MSLNAIREVNKIQERAEIKLNQMNEDARMILIDAETNGKELLEQARAEAAADQAKAIADAVASAQTEANEILQKARQRSSEMQQAAQANVSKAVSFIVEKVVGE